MSELKTNSIDSLNGTDEVSIPTLDQRFAKAWAEVNESQVVLAFYNVTSITDNAIGDYTVNLTNSVGAGLYSAVAVARASTNRVAVVSNTLASSFDIETIIGSSGANSDEGFCFAAFSN